MSFSEWKKYKLEDVLEIKYGKDHKALSEGKIPAYGSGGIMRFVNKAIYEKDSILIPRKGSLNNLFYLNKPFWTVDTMFWTKINLELASPRFLFYQLTLLDYKSMNVGSAVPSLTVPVLNKIDILLPNLKTQNGIASILSSLDDAIELNKQINKTLDEIPKALFKEWFVDFNFPNATDKFQETEIGKIPVGWSVESFEDVFDADRGLSYKGAGLAQSDATPMHNLNSVLEGGGYKTIGIKYYTGDYKDKHIVNAGELIIANTEQGHKYMLIGYPAIIPQFYGEHGIFSHHIYRLRPKKKCWLSPDFMYHLLLQPQVRDQVIGFANGTTVNMLKIEGLHKPKFAMPPKELADKFTAIARANRLQAEQNIEENQSLSNLRDTLLPKLMKGEIALNIT
ncbi:MAG: restriction endonuclease subunit S [Chitinophagaceae bacterium]|nr:restriction endonuclease subunit S [Chitinophagaceae bacterium]